jgi:ketosteroid isomerase-like protein
VSNAERLIAILAPIFGDAEIVVDDALIDRIVTDVEPLTTEDLTVVMVGAEFVELTFEGIEGMRAAWSDWLEAFERVRFQIGSVEEVGENVVTLARQVGLSRHGVEIEQPSAAVWKFRDGRLARVEFHLDAAAAARSARGESG